MHGHVRLGTIWGIPIGLHLSWVVVFGLVAWSLAGGYFPAEYPGWARGAYWVVGAVTALLFFASVLVHELGHSWVALRHGIPIRSITLFIFGGVAQIGREPETPGVELRIAIAGPLTSFGLALAFAAAGFLAQPVPFLAAPAVYLARINGLLALFNLIPGFPLDGGRVFRAMVWGWTGSFDRASQLATTTGQLVAFGFIGYGIVSALGGNALGGVWMILIGWFLQNAAAATHAQASLRGLLRGVTVDHAMTREYAQVGPDVPLDRLVHEEVLAAGRRCFVVTDGGRLRGLLTLHEVKAVPRERWEAVRAGEVMTPAERLATADPGEDLLAALGRMDDAGVAQLPVVSHGALVGLISREQVLHYVRVRSELGM